MAQLKSAFTVKVWCFITFSWGSSQEPEGFTYITSCNGDRGHIQHAKLGGFGTTLAGLRRGANQDNSRSNDSGESELHVEIEIERKYELLVSGC
jgi:hypothetical protein